ncbi:MAG: NTP transferase domain-containing protein [Candidatus Limnocylindrales bacterium]
MTSPARVGAVVLAAGAATRFGGGKLLADLEGRPVLQHVLDALAGLRFGETVVVVGDDCAAVEQAIKWHGERRVCNPEPERGLASSLRVGMATLGMGLQAALIVLGDQPSVRPEVVKALLEAEGAGRRPVVVPRYAEGGGRNPVLLGRTVWKEAAELVGDRGLGPWLATHPEAVLEVPVAGANPDIDTPADLAALAWAMRVRANRAQVDRVREAPDGADFYASTTSIFRADPDRTDDEVLDVLRALARPADVWVDVGAGAGRYALPLARLVREVVAVEPSPGMQAALQEDAAQYAIANVRALAERWPMADPPQGDVALIAHVGYDIEAIGTFLDALEASAARACVAVLMERAPAAAAAPYFEAIHGERRIPLPALADFLALLRARGRAPEVRLLSAHPARYATFEELLGFLRRQTWVAEGGQKDRRLIELARERAIREDDRWGLLLEPPAIGVVTWEPGRPGAG